MEGTGDTGPVIDTRMLSMMTHVVSGMVATAGIDVTIHVLSVYILTLSEPDIRREGETLFLETKFDLS